MPHSQTIKKDFYLPVELVTKSTTYAKQWGTTFSEFVRSAIQEKLEYLERTKIEEEIGEACRSYYEHDKRIAAEWRTAESKV